MKPKFTTLLLLLTMSASTRLAITTRDVAGPQLSPLAGQSPSSWHFSSVMRHMPMALVLFAAKLLTSLVVPARHGLVGPGVQVLAGPTHELVSLHGFTACWIWQA